MIIKRIPMNALQKGVFTILSTYQTTTIYDDVPSNAAYPYITIGAFTSKNNGNKTTDISDVSMQLHIWSDYAGKLEVNGIADDVTAVLTTWPIDLSASGFKVISQDVDFFEAFDEAELGYHGVVTFVARVQNLGG